MNIIKFLTKEFKKMIHFCQDELNALVYAFTHWRELKNMGFRLWFKLKGNKTIKVLNVHDH